MKKIILMVLISFCFKLNAQIETPKGVHFINNSWSAAFLKADKNGVLWQGSGARDKNGIRSCRCLKTVDRFSSHFLFHYCR